MTMQLFSFGHPCEHQLRRTCIGGSSCPLHGYPDSWCCSYVKGKINFKRDKPCEGPRCRWGFTHPTQAQFDAVTQVIAEGKAIGASLDESGPNDLLNFQIDSSHVVDTVQCALHVMKHPPSSCGKKIGQLLAYAAMRAQEVKVFTQLLKTMKKPIDSYLLGAIEFLAHLKATGGAAAAKKGKKDDAIAEELRSDIVDVMCAALSQGGQLVIRDDQKELQQVYINALKTFPKNRKKVEMLELAQTKFKLTAGMAPPVTSQAAPPAAPAPPCNIDTPELPPATPQPQAGRPKQQQELAKPDEIKGAAGPKKVEPSPLATLQSNKRVIAISRSALAVPMPTEPRKYTPLHPLAETDVLLQDMLILGGLFSLSSNTTSLLGPASSKVSSLAPPETNSPLRLLAEHGPSMLDASSNHHSSGRTNHNLDDGVAVARGSGFSAIFGSDVPAFSSTSQADQSLLEGVMHAWGH